MISEIIESIVGKEAEKIMAEVVDKFAATPLTAVVPALKAAEETFTPDTDVVSCEAPTRNYKTAACYEPGIPHSAQARKETPVTTGVLAYFPDAIAEIAKVSYIGNQQHNPGQPLHWARGKSMDQTDAAVRHVMEYSCGVRRDKDGMHVLAQAAWRVLAELQIDIEKAKGDAK